MTTWIMILVWVTLFVNVAFLVQLIRLYRRFRRLDMLMTKICTDAFMNAHLPIWMPWADTFGFEFKIKVMDREKRR